MGQENYAFGFLFIAIAIAVAAASILSEIAFLSSLSLYYYAVIWIGCFVITFVSLFYKKYGIIKSSFRERMKSSIKWPTYAKAINGICWAGPFFAIAFLPSLLPYLILVGIGSGNTSTYLLLRKYKCGGRDIGYGQLLIGLISFAAIPVALEVHVAREDIAIMMSRILISFAYAAGGVYAIMIER